MSFGTLGSERVKEAFRGDYRKELEMAVLRGVCLKNPVSTEKRSLSIKEVSTIEVSILRGVYPSNYSVPDKRGVSDQKPNKVGYLTRHINGNFRIL